ncbi:hypothetical protein HPB49_012214 [Dermacentor silvarum]|uniref:Uncharacterized protein n=1 Tax=Dermacentor silvarum TaxID=543639 RepID=A0ACB8C3J6_DERSI|nr:hypothetical protein HPB49_012214 [Dermacentor silvarum]
MQHLIQLNDYYGFSWCYHPGENVDDDVSDIDLDASDDEENVAKLTKSTKRCFQEDSLRKIGLDVDIDDEDEENTNTNRVDQDREKGPQQSKKVKTSLLDTKPGVCLGHQSSAHWKDPLPGGRVSSPGRTGQGSTIVQPATLEVRRTGAARNARGVAAILAQQPPQKSLGSPDCAGTAGRDNQQPGQQRQPE